MKTRLTYLIILLFSFANSNVLASDTPAFELSKTGSGKRNLIFIPGFACSGDVWNDTRKLFENEFTCYTLTMAGFAGAKPQEHPKFDEWVKSIAQYIKANHIEKPVIIGHSMGGGLAMALAALYPELIEKIIIVDALPCISAMMNPNFQSKENPDCTEMINQVTTASNDQFYQMQKQTAAAMAADTGVHERIVSWSMRTDRNTFAEMYCDFSNTDLRESIKTISCPALVLLEPYFSNFKPAIESQYRQLPNAQLRYANKGLHFIMFDDPEWFALQLHEFIR